ncbi:serine/threonine protein phosphatase [Altererythrobacter salegens]|uniref:Serine/threonine protein phosphatase n=1 Tax=Croceibacterium salegens TaxID=1737568 RepID=A0A6I4SY45_9SPHN|nr:serine/threonine protein phosphatase [Croceibacterium salegens]
MRFKEALWTLSNLAATVRSKRLPSTCVGERVYAVGDIHGRLDLFRKLLAQLEEDSQSRKKGTIRIILLGDLVDRGPQSREMLELAKRMELQNRGRLVVLCGNHEDLLLASANGNADAQQIWLANGGDATLASYGLDISQFVQLSPKERGDALKNVVGIDTLDWLKRLPLSYRNGDYFYCHAGVRPGVSLCKQRREDLLWIRQEFLQNTNFHGAMIVHGHSETSEPEIMVNRINIDTRAYSSNELTALGMQGPYRWFVSTARKYVFQSALDASRIQS